ncbi:SusD/RagB family nutrient-binding outer membrane lipoprotein [Pedobacter sp. KBW06]|uniref:SusD/RagB family nutrient-binding outer membrane lipoprotein n=1 Tax=Pedobacter sp. KBW06 TaxID=2153359 RepID=UPI000F590E9D|nr:SusD/RagB family nutrient-binding outer membrane lipoprotein [Pedobacter sp. KBW06]RQO69469.1 SusD/RagB family nutrient-binding outer membrane lipoprotein [Pedobacter sp. KBW06]
MNHINHITNKLVIVLLSGFILCNVSCKKNFAETNTNPSVVTKPDINALFSYSVENLESYQGTEWVWENLEQLLRYTQHLTTDPYELSTNINSRYRTYYNGILPNLFAIRNEVATKGDKERYKNINAVTYIVQILHGLKVTDMNGSIPYLQAIQGRTDNNFKPVYDNQKTLYDTWLKELDAALADLKAGGSDQVNFGSADFFYKNNWSSWAKLANTLKLRIAVRYEKQDVEISKRIFKEVMTDAAGPIDNDDLAQFVYDKPEHNPIGNDIDYRSPRFGTSSIVNFLKANNDPRLKIYFSPNELLGNFKDVLIANGKTLPSFINLNDPLIMYQGGPADWTTDPAVATYYKNPFPVNASVSYKLMSTINKKFFAPRYGSNTTGKLLDYMVTYAETCFYIAEFIQKGYGAGFDTKGTAEDWYKKGVTSSIKTMNKIAVNAVSTTGFEGSGDAEIAAYLNQPGIKFNGSNDLERIYIQEYLNFYRLANEAFTFCRRTGYPKNNSAYYARNTWNEPIPRRYALDEPPVGTNNENWLKAQQEQGFTPGNKELQVLSSQRLWFDKNSPNFGAGN